MGWGGVGWGGVGWGGGGGGGRASFERGGGGGGFEGGGRGGVWLEHPPPLSLRTKMYHSRFFSFWCWGFFVKTDHSFLEGCC